MKMCDDCGVNPANIHLTQIINNETTISHLCEHCAEKKGISISLAEELQNLEDEEQQHDMAVTCPQCGTSLADFKESGRLGCAHCYYAFEKDIEELLIQMHGTSEHKGKGYCGEAFVFDQSDIKRLRHEMDIAVRNEKFELAAELRDKISNLSSGMNNGVSK